MGLRKLLGDLRRGVLHQEADGDHEIVAALGEASQVLHIIRLGGRLNDIGVNAELLRRPEQAFVRKLVEAAVVEPADIGDEADPPRQRLRRGAGEREGQPCDQEHDAEAFHLAGLLSPEAWFGGRWSVPFGGMAGRRADQCRTDDRSGEAGGFGLGLSCWLP